MKKTKTLILVFMMMWMIILGLALTVIASTLHVGSTYKYASIQSAAAVAQPGDTILVHKGVYNRSEYLVNLRGTSNAEIRISNAPGDTVIFRGGGEAWHLTDVAFLHISGFIFEQQTSNGVNIDDGGTYTTPSHHILIENCTFRNMNASGNNDLLKLSGLDYFRIENCSFLNGSTGGSGVDMVGCHNGIFFQNTWENMGSNCIQAKGGTQYLLIEANLFKNGGARALNLGGSTGLQFFRPDTAHFEAADIEAYANVIIGAEAAVAYVGVVRVKFQNNTIYKPGKWVLRILQETVDTNRFMPCGENSFVNNLVVIDNAVNTQANIGPNTAPTTFYFSNNLWFHTDNPTWSGPTLPVSDVDNVVGKDPLFKDVTLDDFSIPLSSPAVAKGLTVSQPRFDFLGMAYNTPPSIGAFEGNPVLVQLDEPANIPMTIFPNPTNGQLTISFENEIKSWEVVCMNLLGQRVGQWNFNQIRSADINLPSISGIYLILLKVDGNESVHRIFVK